MRRLLFAVSMLGFTAATGACERRESEQPSTASSVPTDTNAADVYAGFAFPATSGEWGPAEYAQVRDTLVQIERERPDALPTLAGDKGEVLARFVDVKAIDRAFAAAADMNAMLELGDAFAQTYKLYAARVVHGQPFGREYMALANAMLHAGGIQFTRLTAVLGVDEAKLRTEQVRLDGMLGMRHGLAIIYLSALESPLTAPNIIDLAMAAKQLALATTEAAPFLLDIDRRTADAMLTRLSTAGADPGDVAAIRAALSSTQLHPLLAAFAAECEAYSAQQREAVARASETQVLAVEVGPEAGGVRWAFPEAGFSAVFHQRPNAMSSNEVAEDGVTLTLRVLGTRDATGYTTSIICMNRASPMPDSNDFARGAIGDATNVRELDIDGHPGLAGEHTSSISHAQMRTVSIGHGGCSMVAEYPPRLEAAYRDQARAFLDSVRFGSFAG